MSHTRSSPAWRFLEAHPDERARFPDLATTLALAAPTPVAPPNRLRSVHLVRAGHRLCYLKTFRATPAKNRFRNATTAPRCRSDAEREALVATALRAAGFPAARPVAVARDGGASHYLCAEVDGTPLSEALATGSASAELLHAAAVFCGRAFAAGFSLPDLAPEHLFVGGAGGPRFTLIDLHNGAHLSRPDPRAARRALRRTIRAVRGSPLARSHALRLALVFLRTANLADRARHILERLPPLDTHGRYDAPGKATAYHARNPERSAAELDLLADVWPGDPGAAVLDTPCGAGRLRTPLTQIHGARWHGADRTAAMLRTARRSAGGEPALVLADARSLPFVDRAFDGVVAFRFLHHLPPADARDVVREATRIASRFVVVSYFHPLSAHHITRSITEAATRRTRSRHALWTQTLKRWFAAEGFEPYRVRAQPPVLRDLRVASFVRVEA